MNKRASGGSRHSVNNAPTRGAMVDPQTYGMLIWQSKLQEKLLQEQKEKKQKDLEEQQRQIEERHQTEQQERIEQHRARQTPILEIPQMMPRPAPYTITTTPRSPQPPVTPMSPEEGNGGSGAAISSNLIPNGETPTERSMFPSISNRMRSSVSCDNFGGKPPSLFLGNIVSFQQMGGAGSPRRTPSGKLITILRGDPEIRYHQKDSQSMRYLMDREKVTEYKRELDLQIEEKRKWRSQVGSAAIKEITRKGFIETSGNNNSKSYTSPGPDYLHHNHHHPLGDTFSSERGFGGGLEAGNNKSGTELAPLMRMRKFNSLPKLNSLSSTDVTRPYVHSPRNEFFHPIQANEVAENLHSQLKEKEWLTRRHQENERLATQRHFQTWDSLWGRPGAGAPLLSFMDKSLGHAVSSGNLFGAGQQQQRMGHNKVNLFKAIHMTHQQNKPQ